MLKAAPLVGKWTAWAVGKGNKLRLGEDPWIGVSGNYTLSAPLLARLHDMGVHTLESG
jgi:hypothetical protein